MFLFVQMEEMVGTISKVKNNVFNLFICVFSECSIDFYTKITLFRSLTSQYVGLSCHEEGFCLFECDSGDDNSLKYDLTVFYNLVIVIQF